ncbi:GNAT family N-acetyltransferase [Chroogloeocystis siderophila]|jgi:putative acetyltransferase|uniref:GNAT family N-acetyltransferase n=1 Tax=Chroogloeocystis siderophila 5.2 s.c.1 TaxID=247279 RepID=A0A1U7I071_9CHRO|nr:N-acetyltransferase [Chroogloeocystis siderophila]OKH29271.1 GNAT family N-acetyltransferase [Chroogloeocystis siderophila 5.2 s.c.1]
MIRCENALDTSAIYDVHTQAFERENEAQLVDKIRDSDCYIPQLSLVAEVDNTVVGHILFSCIELVGKENLRVLGLAPLAVVPKFQRQGIGSALVQVGLETAETMGEALVVVLGHPQFYARFGFQPSLNYGIKSPFPVPADAFMVKLLTSYQEKYQGTVVYPPAFQEV